MNRGLKYSIALSLASVISGCQTPQRETSSPLEQEVQVVQTALKVEAPEESKKEINKVPKKYDAKDLTITVSKNPPLIEYDKSEPPVFIRAGRTLGDYPYISFGDTMPIGMESHIVFNGRVKELEKLNISQRAAIFRLPEEIYKKHATSLEHNSYTFTNQIGVWAVDRDGNKSKITTLYATVRDNSKILAEKKD